MTRALVSRTNDATKQPARPSPLNQARARYILHAFYLEANMHSEVYSLFEALLRRVTKWVDEREQSGGFSMNSLHELMTLCRRAADELDVLQDYRRRNGVAQDGRQQPLALVAVVPAVVATLGVPQRAEIIRQLVTIAPGHRDLIAQLAEHIRMFSLRSWKRVPARTFRKVATGPLKRAINEVIEDAREDQVECIEREHVGDVDRILEGLEAALRASMSTGRCGDSAKTIQSIDTFSKKVSRIVVPKVVLEAARPLSSLRFEVFQYVRQLPRAARPLLQIVTRAVNEKMHLQDIADRVSKAVHPDDQLLVPIVLAPLALVSSLHSVLDLAEQAAPRAPHTFKLIVCMMFAAIQAGDDYYKLAEQIDHDHNMHAAVARDRDNFAVIADNLTAFYSRSNVKRLLPAERVYARSVPSALRRGAKALAWDTAVSRKGDPVLDSLAREARSFQTDTPCKPSKSTVDFWHALRQYTRAASIPFQQQQHQQSASLRDTLSVDAYATAVAWRALTEGQASLGDRADHVVAYETLKLALLCANSECSIDPNRSEFPIVMDLLKRETTTDRALLLGMLLSRPDLVDLVKSRLSPPTRSSDSHRSASFNTIAARLKVEGAGRDKRSRLVEETLSLTLSQSPTDYLKASALLLHDKLCTLKSLDISNHSPAAYMMLYINSSPKVRGRLLVATSLYTNWWSVLGVKEVRFANRLEASLWPPPDAVQYVRQRLSSGASLQSATKLVSIDGLSGRSRFVRLLKRQIVSSAINDDDDD